MPEGCEPTTEFVVRPQSFPRDVPNVRIERLVGGGYVVATPIVQIDAARGREVRVFDANDQLVGSFTIFGYQSNTDIEVSAMPDGGFVVAYAVQQLASGTASSTPGDIYWARFDASGNQVASTIANLNPDAPAYPGQGGTGTPQLQPDVVALADGTSYVVFQDRSAFASDAPDIFLQRIASDGSWIGGPIQVNQDGAGAQGEPEIVALANGNVAVGWVVDGITDSVHVQVLTPAGAVTLADTLVSIGGSTISDLSLDALDGGGFVAVWQRDGDIYGQVLSSSGTVSDAPFLLSTGTVGIQDNPRVQAVDGGGFIVTWEDNASGTGQILARFFDAAGKGQTQFAVAPSGNEQGYPDVARLANGDLVFTWSDDTGHVLRAIRYVHDAPPAPITGTNLNDALFGTAGDDVILAYAGNDSLAGGQGADQLDGGDGIDTASYVTDEGSVFVNLTLGRGYGNAAEGDTYVSIENVIGTQYYDFLIGDAGVNRLDGAGGNDTLIGAVGPDVLVGGSGTDTASYEDNSGTVFVDLLNHVGYNNAAQGDTYDGIENAKGGLFDDTLIGDNGANRLDGAMGADTLVGNGGADTFVFAHAPGATNPFGGANVDTMFDFLSGQDKLEISASAFGGGLTAGSLSDGRFVVGSAAADADDRFVYDQAAGRLWFDADGLGSGAAVLVALLPNHNTIAATDFVIV